jgi:LPXTG-motif cell wall-anchored protein
MVMKKMKRFLSFAMSTMMILTMGTSLVSAETDSSETTYKITITNSASADHTYKAYQILSGEVTKSDTDGKLILTNPEWADDNKVSADQVKKFINELKITTDFADKTTEDGETVYSYWFSSVDSAKTTTSARQLADKLTTLENKSYLLQDEFVNIASKYFADSSDQAVATSGTSTGSDSNYTYTIEGVPAGYYIVKDESGTISGKNETYSKYMMTVVGDTSIETKTSLPELTKDVGISENATYTNAITSNSATIFYFKLTAELQEYAGEYKTYQVTFKDVLPKGMTFKGIASVYIRKANTGDDQGKIALEEDTDYVVDTSSLNPDENGDPIGNGNNAFEIRTRDLKLKDPTLTQDDQIIVKYKAELNEDATLGPNGNVNTVTLRYTNNPYAEATDWKKTQDEDEQPEGETAPASATVFTFNIQGTKVNAANTSQTLSGAQFILYRTSGSDKYYATKIENNIVTKWEKDAEDTAKIDAVIISGEDGTFNVGGIAGGDYYLQEIKAPTGYSLELSPIPVTTKTHLTTATPVTLDKICYFNSTSNEVEATDKTNIPVTITNGAGNTLPSTGGMGRTIIYAIGVILTLSAAILLVVKKRMHANF